MQPPCKTDRPATNGQVQPVEVKDDLLGRVLVEAVRRARTPRLRRWLQRLAEGDKAEPAPASSERGREKG